jgi:hypothetical protein
MKRVYFDYKHSSDEQHTLLLRTMSCSKFVSVSVSSEGESLLHDRLFLQDFIPEAQGGLTKFCEDYYYDNDYVPPQLNWLEVPLNLPALGYHGDILDFSLIILNFVSSVKNVKSLKDFFFPVFTLIKDIAGITYTSVIKRYSRNVYALFSMAFGMAGNITRDFFSSDIDYTEFVTDNPFYEDEPVAQSSSFESFMAKIKTLNGQKKTIVNSEFAMKFANFCGMILALPIFRTREGMMTMTMLGFSKAFIYRTRKEYEFSHPIMLMDEILDSLLFFSDKVYLAIKKNNFSYIFTESEELADYDSEYNRIVYYYDKMDLLCNVIREGGEPTTLDDYMRDVETLKYKNSIFIKQFKDDSRMSSMLRTQKLLLERVQMAIRDKMKVSTERQPPIALIFHGTPGVGKSSLVHHTCELLYENAQVLGRSSKKFDKKSIYCYNEEDKYFSNFRAEHESIWMDDVGQLQPRLVESNGGGAIRKSCNLINSVPYITEQASVENKGMIPFLCKYVFITTNVRDAGISDVFRTESGALRRPVFLDVSVKDEFRKEGTTMLAGCNDPTKHDMWNITPRSYDQMGRGTNEKVWDKKTQLWVRSGVPVEPLNMREYQVFLRDEVQAKHYIKNDVAKECVEHFMEVGLCNKCKVNASICDCVSELERMADEAGYTDDEEESDGDEDVFTQDKYRDKDIYDDHLVPQAQGGFKADWPLVYFVMKTLGWSGMWKLVCFKIEFEWQRLKSNLNGLYKIHRRETHIALGITATISFLLMVRQGIKFYRRMGKFDDEPVIQGNIPTVNTPLDKTKNPWIISHEETKITNVCQKTCTFDQLSKLVTRNCVVLQGNLLDGKETSIRAFGIHGCTIAVPKHWVDEYIDDWKTISIIRNDQRSPVGPSRENLYVDSTCIKYFPDQDVCFMTHPGFGNFRDIRKFLLDSRFKGKHEGSLIMRNDDGAIAVRSLYGLQSRDFNYHVVDGTLVKCNGYFAQVNIRTHQGDCGGVYIVKTMRGCFIAGIHIAAKFASNNRDYLVYCQPVLNNMKIEPVTHSFNGLDLPGTYPKCQQDFVEKIHPKDPILEAEGSMTVYGDTAGFRPKIISDVCNTIMNEDVCEHFGLLENTHVSPKGVSRRVCLLNNYNAVGVKATFPPKNIKKCTDALYIWYTRIIRENELDIPSEPYDKFVGINGLDRDKYINRLPVNTSAGFTRGGRKDKYLVQVPSDENHELKYDFNDDLQKEYNLLIERYSRGERGQVVWNYNFKDEPISHEKHGKSKVRLFNAGPLAFNVLFRQYFAWTLPLFTGKLRHKFGHAIGGNPFSKDWHILYKYITMHGDQNMIAGDYKSFDKKQPAEVLWAVFEVLFRIARDSGFSQEHIFIMRGLATDVCYSLCNVFGTLIELQGNNPSGNPLTTVLNGMVNITYIMLACDIIATNNDIDIQLDRFQDYVSILTYGDDNVMSSKVPQFNHTTISKVLQDHGLVYTMADKKAESIPFISIDEVSFLKRSFVPGVHGSDTIAAPLEESSIIKSLHVCTKSRSIEFIEQNAQIIYSANMEYGQYSRDKFEKENKFLNSLLDKYNMRMYIKDGILPSYDDLIHQNSC